MIENRTTLLMKIHFLTGCQVTNKIDTKESAIKAIQKDF